MFLLLAARACGPGMWFFLTETRFFPPSPWRESRQTCFKYFTFKAPNFVVSLGQRDGQDSLRANSGSWLICSFFKMGPRNSHRRLHLLETSPWGAKRWCSWCIFTSQVCWQESCSGPGGQVAWQLLSNTSLQVHGASPDPKSFALGILVLSGGCRLWSCIGYRTWSILPVPHSLLLWIWDGAKKISALSAMGGKESGGGFQWSDLSRGTGFPVITKDITHWEIQMPRAQRGKGQSKSMSWKPWNPGQGWDKEQEAARSGTAPRTPLPARAAPSRAAGAPGVPQREVLSPGCPRRCPAHHLTRQLTQPRTPRCKTCPVFFSCCLSIKIALKNKKKNHLGLTLFPLSPNKEPFLSLFFLGEVGKIWELAGSERGRASPLFLPATRAAVI